MSEIDLTPIVERLATARKNAGLSQSQVASMLGMNRVSVSNWETGSQTLTLAIFLQLCAIYDASVIWVLTGENPDFDRTHVSTMLAQTRMSIEEAMDTLEALEMSAGKLATNNHSEQRFED